MKKLSFGYSLKNIPTSNEKSYKLRHLEKINIFINKMRWRTIYFINKNKKATEEVKQGLSCSFKNGRSPSQVKDL